MGGHIKLNDVGVFKTLKLNRSHIWLNLRCHLMEAGKGI